MKSKTSNLNASSGWLQRLFLYPLGLNGSNALVAWLLLLSGIIVMGGLWLFEGNIAAVAYIFFVLSIFLISILRPDHSLGVLVFGALIFDQFFIPEFDPITYQADFFRNLKEVSYLPYFDAGVLNPIEIHLLFILIGLAIILAVKKDFSLRPIPVLGPFLFFLTCFLFSFLYGMKNGGDFLVALWEVRALCYFFILYLIVPQLIRTREQMQALMWIFIIGISFKAFQAVGRFIGLGFTTGGLATLTNHEDPVFIVTLLIFLLALVSFNVKSRQRMCLLILLPFLLLGYYVGLRRAAYASLFFTFIIFVALLPPPTRRRFIAAMMPVAMVLFIYGAVFWNHEGTISRPVQIVRSGVEKPDIETNYEDYTSNLYRDNENYNLAQTVINNTTLGVGFGKKYEQPISLPNIRFSLKDYIPHNEILWVLVKMGAIGFVAFWFFFNAFTARAVKLLRRLQDPYLKAFTILIIAAVINQMVVSYFDLQLTYYRNMIYLGFLMGLLPALEELQKQEQLPQNEDDHP